jgi:Rhomboid family
MVGFVTFATSIVGLVDHRVLDDLGRRPHELAQGQWWRLFTSLLVHDSWLALAFNAVLFVVVALIAERRFSRAEWLLLYFGSGVVGELAGVVWQPHGAGNSVAALGLAGGLAVSALGPDDLRPVSLAYPAIVLAVLVGTDVGGGAGTFVTVAALAAPGLAVQYVQRHPGRPIVPLLGGALVVEGFFACAVQDIHGPALLCGAVAASVSPRYRESVRRALRRGSRRGLGSGATRRE